MERSIEVVNGRSKSDLNDCLSESDDQSRMKVCYFQLNLNAERSKGERSSKGLRCRLSKRGASLIFAPSLIPMSALFLG